MATFLPLNAASRNKFRSPSAVRGGRECPLPALLQQAPQLGHPLGLPGVIRQVRELARVGLVVVKFGTDAALFLGPFGVAPVLGADGLPSDPPARNLRERRLLPGQVGGG